MPLTNSKNRRPMASDASTTGIDAEMVNSVTAPSPRASRPTHMAKLRHSAVITKRLRASSWASAGHNQHAAAHSAGNRGIRTSKTVSISPPPYQAKRLKPCLMASMIGEASKPTSRLSAAKIHSVALPKQLGGAGGGTKPSLGGR